MTLPTGWTVEIQFTENEDKTRADAALKDAPIDLRSWGQARRSSTDPDTPRVGDEIAIARTLADVSRHLFDQAAHRIESWTGHTIRLTH